MGEQGTSSNWQSQYRSPTTDFDDEDLFGQDQTPIILGDLGPGECSPPSPRRHKETAESSGPPPAGSPRIFDPEERPIRPQSATSAFFGDAAGAEWSSGAGGGAGGGVICGGPMVPPKR